MPQTGQLTLLTNKTEHFGRRIHCKYSAWGCSGQQGVHSVVGAVGAVGCGVGATPATRGRAYDFFARVSLVLSKLMRYSTGIS